MGGQRNRVLGRLSGILFLGAALVGVPALVLLNDPPIASWAWFILAWSAITGVVALVIPWHRIARRWLHTQPPIAIVQIVLSIVAAGEHAEMFRWFFILSAIFIAYAFRRRAEVVCHIAVLSCGLATTSVVGTSEDLDALIGAMVALPTIWLAAGVVVWLRESLERRERTDPLTGLHNRRALMAALNAIDGPITLALFDLDGFKRYNDRLGHAAGDALLERLALRLQAAVRGHGTAYRLGGDELCVLVDDPAALAACDTALREGEIRASFGAAQLPDEAATPSAALSLVDARMYAAKRAAHDAPFVADVRTTRAFPSPSLPATPRPPR